MQSAGTGESNVPRPLSHDKFREVVDPEWLVDYFSAVMDVPVPTIRATTGTRTFSGSYKWRYERITYTKPWAGVLLHELAHHVCQKRGLDGRGNIHGQAFGEVLQEMIDLWV